MVCECLIARIEAPRLLDSPIFFITWRRILVCFFASLISSGFAILTNANLVVGQSDMRSTEADPRVATKRIAAMIESQIENDV